jgi:2-polyprenyl-3-methyl-5-hydroxy-6-metoxy-1,4-benzoquinol methylase
VAALRLGNGEREQRRWERLAHEYPYWAVINETRFRTGSMTDGAREAFFASGERDVAITLGAIRRWIDPAFRPERALDFGCGVGRLTIPLARAAGHVVGVDISTTMLAEARRNAEAHGIANVEFALSTTYLRADLAPGELLDFVHSYIVLQHIAPPAGERITAQLLQRLRPGGVAALHYTYARQAPRVRRVVNRLRRWMPPVNMMVNVLQGRPAREPQILMYNYDLRRLFATFARHGCATVHALLTDHGGHLGAILVVRKAAEHT